MKDALNPKIIEEGLELYDFDYEFDEALKWLINCVVVLKIVL